MAKDFSYYFSQLRRIEDHREEKAEKEIRKLYKKLLKETRQFISEEYYALAKDGKLTYEILRSKGRDARFLQEIEQQLGGLSLDVSKTIRNTVEEMYQLAYDGMVDAVRKASDLEQFKEDFKIKSSAEAEMIRATVDNPIMEVALEKNHKENIWNIKREVATALTVGDRFDTMANRLTKVLNGNYKKAILISRTEVGRVREAGHLASAKDINTALEQGSSGLRMVKKWKSMRDGRVRDQHQSMHNKVVEMNENFVLPDGTETQAPKQSGVARHDCNCRCTTLFPLMDDEEFFKATGKHFSKISKNSVEMAEKAAYNDGGRFTNLQFFANRGIVKQTNPQLEKSLNSWKEQIKIHNDKIKNPAKYDAEWESKSEAEKAGLIRHWKKEVYYTERNIKEAEEELRKRRQSE